MASKQTRRLATARLSMGVDLERTDEPVRIWSKFAGELLDSITYELRRSFGRKDRDHFAGAIVRVEAGLTLD